MTRSQIDKLAERLKAGNVTEPDLRLLDNYRRSFADAYERVMGVLRDGLKLEPTGRPAKSTTSIVEKLRRESIRLSQIQDIAGCRVIVDDISAQNKTIVRLREAFEHVTVIDRREKPSHGYRAVHVIVKSDAKPIEIQVRTALQHLCLQLLQRASEAVG